MAESGIEADKKFMDRFSRQIGAYGAETMSKLIKLRVLIVGLKGLGIETAKNLVLAGPAAVTLHDEEPTKIEDVGANFFLRPDEVGQRRDIVVAPRLSQLNEDVEIRTTRQWTKSNAERLVRSGAIDAAQAEAAIKSSETEEAFPLTEAAVAAHDIVVFTTGTRDDLLRWNMFCRTRTQTVFDTKGEATVVPRPIKFISATSLGASASMFVDFGPGFMVHDHDGEPPVVRHIRHITNEKEGIVTLLTEEEGGSSHHNMPESDHNGYVTFSEVEGMYAKDHSALHDLGLNINLSGPWRVTHNTRMVMKKQRDGSFKETEVFDPYSFKIGDTSRFTPYLGRGFVTQHKKPTAVESRPLGATLQMPFSNGIDAFSFNAIDGNKFFRGIQLHLALQAVWEYESINGSLPPVGDPLAAAEVLEIAKSINASLKRVQSIAGADAAGAVDDIDEDVVKTYAMYAAAELQPIAAFMGGVLAQEIVKACAKFKPHDQWFHFDAFEILPDERPADTKPVGSRYDHLISVFGAAFVEKIQNQRTFMVGCGALGCEFLKNFALLGLATGPKGCVYTTDNDRIEISNLNRQFLFRKHNVGQPKSAAAATAVQEMNPAIKVDARESLVCEETEDIFNDDFWSGLDFVTNALDNVKARNYVDSRCVFFEKALLESGTMGTKANVQIVLPHKTISYADGPREDETAIPMCTIRNFPSMIEHCIEWARTEFHSLFVHPFQQAQKVTKDPTEFVAELRAEVNSKTKRGDKWSLISKRTEELKAIRTVVDTASSAMTFEKCVALAYDRFFFYFRDRIASLIAKFPKDHKTRDGDEFWSGTKRFPTPASFDPNNEYHMMFLMATANILAAAYGVVKPPEEELLPEEHEYRNPEYLKGIIAALPVPEVRIMSVQLEESEGGNDDEEDGGEEERKDSGAAGGGIDAEFARDEAALEEELAYISALAGKSVRLEPADFEKDEDMNFHIDFITSASNLRAANYEITQATRHKCKMIAGKIIPAIATTTAAITGLVCLELFKLLGDKPLSAFRDCNLNLGVNAFQFFEPTEARVEKGGTDPQMMTTIVPYKPEGFTKWDKIVVREGDITLQQLIDIVKERHGITINFIESALASSMEVGKPVYSGFGKKDAKITDICRTKFGDAVPVVRDDKNHMILLISAENDAGEDVAAPPVVFYWK